MNSTAIPGSSKDLLPDIPDLSDPDISISTEDESSLTHLSLQLQAYGHLNRSLDLISLFNLPPTPILATGTTQTDKEIRHALRAEQRARAKEDSAREQIVRCLWSLLEKRKEMVKLVEDDAGNSAKLIYDCERAEKMLEKEKLKILALQKEVTAEKAKTLAANNALSTEIARHRQTKEDLKQARGAIHLVKVHAQHDRNRRELEHNNMLNRLQKQQSSDPIQSKYIILNPILKSNRPNPSQGSSSSHFANNAEIMLLEESLQECDDSRKRAESENMDLRELIGEVEEWSEGMLKLNGIGQQRHVVEVNNSVPLYLAGLPSTLAPVIYQNLHEIRSSVVGIIEKNEEIIKDAVADMVITLESEKLVASEALSAKLQAEKTLAIAQKEAAAATALVGQFSTGAFLAGGGMSETPRSQDLYNDQTPYHAKLQAPLIPRLSNPTQVESKKPVDVRAFMAETPGSTGSRSTSSSPAINPFTGDDEFDTPAPPIRTSESVRPKAASIPLPPGSPPPISRNIVSNSSIPVLSKGQARLKELELKQAKNAAGKVKTSALTNAKIDGARGGMLSRAEKEKENERI